MTQQDAPEGRVGEKREEKACRCGRCGTRYEHAAFLTLALVERLGSEAIAEHVVRWPDGEEIDVRTCSACQSPIARLSRPMETSRKDG